MLLPNAETCVPVHRALIRAEEQQCLHGWSPLTQKDKNFSEEVQILATCLTEDLRQRTYDKKSTDLGLFSPEL